MNTIKPFAKKNSQREGIRALACEGEIFDFDRVSACETLDELYSADENATREFAKNPFGGIESKEVFFQFDDEFTEDIINIGADSISSLINRRAFQNSEKLEFSDPTVLNDKYYDLSVVSNFMAVRPENFLFNFDAEESIKDFDNEKTVNPLEINKNFIENALPAREEQKKNEIKNPSGTEEEILEELELTDEILTPYNTSCFDGFMFSSFASDYGKLVELPVDAIIQDSDGVFSISDEISVTDVVQDPAFRDLVNSVLH